MGFEQVVPPIPDRRQEIQGLNRLEQNWLNQPYYKYYMNESLRQPKLAYSQRINKLYSQYWRNALISGIILLPVALLCRRFLVYRAGVPTTFMPDYFQKVRPDHQIRRNLFAKWIIPGHIASTLFLANYLTCFDEVFDMNQEFYHKPPRMI